MVIDGKIQFPVNNDEWIALMSGAVSGVITLTSGSATILNDRINRSMFPLLQRISTSGTPGFLSISLGNGQATITSSSSSDTSMVAYLLIPYFNVMQ
jgi:hypothetical protein